MDSLARYYFIAVLKRLAAIAVIMGWLPVIVVGAILSFWPIIALGLGWFIALVAIGLVLPWQD